MMQNIKENKRQNCWFTASLLGTEHHTASYELPESAAVCVLDRVRVRRRGILAAANDIPEYFVSHNIPTAVTNHNEEQQQQQQ